MKRTIYSLTRAFSVVLALIITLPFIASAEVKEVRIAK